MDYTAGKFWFDVLQWFITLGIGVYAWLTNRHRATREQIAEVEKRLTRTEETIKHLPDDDELGKMYDRINALHVQLSAVNASLGAIGDTMKSVQRSVSVINDYLLNNKT